MPLILFVAIAIRRDDFLLRRAVRTTWAAQRAIQSGDVGYSFFVPFPCRSHRFHADVVTVCEHGHSSLGCPFADHIAVCNTTSLAIGGKRSCALADRDLAADHTEDDCARSSVQAAPNDHKRGYCPDKCG